MPMVSELAPGMEQILSDLDKIDQKITLNFYGTAGFRSLNKLNLFKKPLGDDLRDAIKTRNVDNYQHFLQKIP